MNTKKLETYAIKRKREPAEVVRDAHIPVIGLLHDVGLFIRSVGTFLECWGTCEDAEDDEIYCSNDSCTYCKMCRAHEVLRKRVEP